MTPGVNQLTAAWPDNACAYISLQPLSYYMVHSHSFFELEFAVSGSVRHIVGDESGVFRQGDLWFLSPASVHHFYTDNDHPGVVRWLLYFDPAIISDAVWQSVDVEQLPFCLHMQGDDFTTLRVLFRSLDVHAQSMYLPRTEFVIRTLESLILHLFDRRTPATVTLPSRLQPALVHIQSHFRSSLTIEDAAQTVHLSVPHFSKLFHAHMGLSYRAYVLNLRLTYAYSMLSDPTKRVQDVCFDAGFQTPEYFSRAFKKKFGISPEQHRENRLSR